MEKKRCRNRLGRSFVSAVANHREHKLRLEVDDHSCTLFCVFCGSSLFRTSGMEPAMFAGTLNDWGVTFEILCQSVFPD